MPLALAVMCAAGLFIAGGAARGMQFFNGLVHRVAPNLNLPLPLPRELPRVELATEGFASWAMLNRRTGAMAGSTNLDAPSDTMSLVKVWLAADFLRRNETPDQASLDRITVMIRDSDNRAADAFYARNGGPEGIARMVDVCGLTDSAPFEQPWWSNTIVSARDVARLGACVADGRAAGPIWTEWLLDVMRSVQGTGDFGPRSAFPVGTAAHIAIKNGWLLRTEDKLWHMSCLAVTDDWSIGVLLRYPSWLGFEHGTRLCQSVAEQLMPALVSR
ncbi:class A beta-lactamase-related serine hydrolase [Catellatospora tritici]|uniref:class A beta-lactamase-related serine hydrolase n=1 Tax=Catellatospora tritici TaxID=2851566 RepID=UPI001C2DA7BB|nr:class A beta-lactamase-related serine hydrolase [Catellatospora tritici]MBV1855385.1 class A beta-lactamase-related serine hydrolase [Catellatospora tritici]